jgi:cell division transport system permease protein
MSVIIKNETGEEAIMKLKKELENDKRILNTVYISREQALAEESEALKTNPAEILGYNPYEASLEITMEPKYANSGELQAIEKGLLKKKEVKEVIYQKDLVDTINANIRKAGAILLALLAMLTIISWSLIGNMVRLSIYSQRFILHTMKLVGASWGFICRPFIIKNMWIGIFSGIVANAALAGGLYLLQQSEPEITRIIHTEKLAAVGIIVIAFGMTICMLCALMSVLRFLRMRRNDLYFI